MTLADVLTKSAGRQGDAPAVVFDDDTLSYRELADWAARIATSLRSLDIEKGDHVAVWMPNNLEFLPVYFGIAMAGAVMVPMNTRYRTHEARYILSDSEAKAIVMVPRFLKMRYDEMLREIAPSLEHLEHAVVVNDDADVGVSSMAYEAFLSAGRDAELPDVSDGDISQILYTSGTTGKPKGVMLSHANVCDNARVTGEVMETTPADRYFVPLPLFHSFGLVLGCLTPLIFGASIVLQDVFDAEHALQLMEQHRCTMNFGVPAMFMMELEAYRDGEYALGLRSGMMGGAPCPIEVVKGVRREMDCDVCIGYGITETSPLISLTRYGDDDRKRAETVGLPLPGVEVRVVDDRRRPLPPGEVGEIAIRGNVMQGYYNMPEATAEAVDDGGWYYSGDLGVIDSDGYLSITGRKKDMVVVGGFNVYPREIEEVLFTHPRIKNAAVVGVPDDRLGEVVKAYIVPDGDLSEREVKAFLGERMANFKVPAIVAFVDSFPMTASGKVQKYKLREDHDPSM
ncbi:MAG: long-chain-fatty-acid--CoA ligase [Thermoplasmatota archaeon]